MRQLALSCVADAALVSGIVHCKLVIVAYRTGRGNEDAYQAEPSEPVKRIH